MSSRQIKELFITWVADNMPNTSLAFDYATHRFIDPTTQAMYKVFEAGYLARD